MKIYELIERRATYPLREELSSIGAHELHQPPQVLAFVVLPAKRQHLRLSSCQHGSDVAHEAGPYEPIEVEAGGAARR